MVKRILFISITLILVALLLMVFLSLIKNKPESEIFVRGKIYGQFRDVFNSTYKFRTYDSKNNQIREEIIDIFLFRSFIINFNDNEKYFSIWQSQHEEKYLNNKSFMMIFTPEGLIEIFPNSGEKIDFCVNKIYYSEE